MRVDSSTFKPRRYLLEFVHVPSIRTTTALWNSNTSPVPEGFPEQYNNDYYLAYHGAFTSSLREVCYVRHARLEWYNTRTAKKLYDKGCSCKYECSPLLLF